jgi:hypothetical protein
MQANLIIIKEYCLKCEVESTFIEILYQEGLIDIIEEENERFILHSQLKDIEQYCRWYYDLSINVEGIDAIRHLLKRMQALQEELKTLQRKL